MIPQQWLKTPNDGVVVDVSHLTFMHSQLRNKQWAVLQLTDISRLLLSPLVRQMQDLVHEGWVIVAGLKILPEQVSGLFTGRKPPHIRMYIEVLRQSIVRTRTL